MALLFTSVLSLRRFPSSANAARCSLCRQRRLVAFVALVVADAGQPYLRRRRAPCALGHINRLACDLRSAGGVAMEKLRLRLQHRADRLSPSGRRHQAGLWRSCRRRHVGGFRRLPVEGVPRREAGLLAVLLRKALPDFRCVEVRAHRCGVEGLGKSGPWEGVWATLDLLSSRQGFWS